MFYREICQAGSGVQSVSINAVAACFCGERSPKPAAAHLNYPVIWFKVICMSTVLEMKRAFARLPELQKIQFARWLQTQVDNRLSDDEKMAIAAEGARKLDRREAQDGRSKAI